MVGIYKENEKGKRKRNIYSTVPHIRYNVTPSLHDRNSYALSMLQCWRIFNTYTNINNRLFHFATVRCVQVQEYVGVTWYRKES